MTDKEERECYECGTEDDEDSCVQYYPELDAWLCVCCVVEEEE